MCLPASTWKTTVAVPPIATPLPATTHVSPTPARSLPNTSPGGAWRSTCRWTARAGTPFQRQVWQALLEIPYGETITYGELARRIGQPAAVRAVGLANGSNPLSVVVPCHRVIGAGGKLIGYGGGLDRKRLLLDLEARSRPGTLFTT